MASLECPNFKIKYEFLYNFFETNLFSFFKKILDPNGVPSHEDVALPSSNQITAVPDVLQSPLSHHRRGFIVNCKFIALTTGF